MTYSGTLTSGQVAVLDGTAGKIKASGYTIATSVPSGAKFTDTDTKVTSVGNHYTPAEDTGAAISAASGAATNITGTAGKLNVVTGLKRDAKGHIVGVTSANIYSTDNNTTYSSKSAASGGTDVSLVTTGEKYTWNAKASTSVATTSANGLMSSSDKSKLDGIAAGAQVNTITGVKGSSEGSYRTGNVNITAANLGITVVNNTADANKSVKYAASAGSCTGNAATATKATGDGSGNNIVNTYATKTTVNGKQDKIPVTDHGTSDTSFALTPNVYHKWGTVTSLTLTLAAPSSTSVYNEYMFEFVSGTTATTLSLPSSVSWVAEPSIEAGKTYQCSIVNNIGVIASA